MRIKLPVAVAVDTVEALNVNAPRRRKFKPTPASKAAAKKRSQEYKKNASKARMDARQYYKKNKAKIAKRKEKLDSLPAQKLSTRSSDTHLKVGDLISVSRGGKSITAKIMSVTD